jgi:hypothetical protein
VSENNEAGLHRESTPTSWEILTQFGGLNLGAIEEWVTALDPKQTVSFEELLMSQVVQQEALTRLLVEKGIFNREEFLEMVRVVNAEMKVKQGI